MYMYVDVCMYVYAGSKETSANWPYFPKAA